MEPAGPLPSGTGLLLHRAEALHSPGLISVLLSPLATDEGSGSHNSEKRFQLAPFFLLLGVSF